VHSSSRCGRGVVHDCDRVVRPAGPSLLWPQETTWCVATKVDHHSTFVGGSEALISGLLTDTRLGRGAWNRPTYWCSRLIDPPNWMWGDSSLPLTARTCPGTVPAGGVERARWAADAGVTAAGRALTNAQVLALGCTGARARWCGPGGSGWWFGRQQCGGSQAVGLSGARRWLCVDVGSRRRCCARMPRLWLEAVPESGFGEQVDRCGRFGFEFAS